MTLKPPRVVVVSRADDLHALAVGSELSHRGVACSVVEPDTFPSTGGLGSWRIGEDAVPAQVRDRDGAWVDLAEVDLCWWRRFPRDLVFPEDTCTGEPERRLVTADTRAALLGAFLTDFRGAWVSDPWLTRAAENKLVQLRAAAAAGFRVPRTLVTQDPGRAREFCESLGYDVVAKPVRGDRLAPVLTGRVTPELLRDDAAIRSSPCIYQELVAGGRHLRVNVFGERCLAYLIESDQLDWRVPLTASVRPTELDAELRDALGQYVADLGLRMGCLDLKLSPSGEPVFLEINPQGQFLFLEGLGGGGLLAAFTAFLVDELDAARRTPVKGRRPEPVRRPAPSLSLVPPLEVDGGPDRPPPGD